MKLAFLTVIAMVIAALVAGDLRASPAAQVQLQNFTDGGVTITLSKSMNVTNVCNGLRAALCGNNPTSYNPLGCLPGYGAPNYQNPSPVSYDIYPVPGQQEVAQSFVLAVNKTWMMYELIGLPPLELFFTQYFEHIQVSIHAAVPLKEVQNRGANQVVIQVANTGNFTYLPWSTVHSEIMNTIQLPGDKENTTLVNSSVSWAPMWGKYVQNFTIACDFMEAQILIQGMNWTAWWNTDNGNYQAGDIYAAWYPSYVPLDNTGVPMTANGFGQRIQFTANSSQSNEVQSFADLQASIFNFASSNTYPPQYRISNQTSIKLVKRTATITYPSLVVHQTFTFSLSKTSNRYARPYLVEQINDGAINFYEYTNPTAESVSGGANTPTESQV